MSTVNSIITLSNPLEISIPNLITMSIADPKFQQLYIPQEIASKLNVCDFGSRDITLNNGNKISVPYVGPIMISFEDRNCFTGALVFGNEIILGKIPMDDMGLEIIANTLSVIRNPKSIVNK